MAQFIDQSLASTSAVIHSPGRSYLSASTFESCSSGNALDLHSASYNANFPTAICGMFVSVTACSLISCAWLFCLGIVRFQGQGLLLDFVSVDDNVVVRRRKNARRDAATASAVQPLALARLDQARGMLL